VLSGGTTSSLVKTGAFVGESVGASACGSTVGPWLLGAIVVGAIVSESDSSLLMRTKL
jgi:hypothetical protein